MPHVYVGSFEAFTESPGSQYWRAPGGDALGMLDLRSNTQCAIPPGGMPVQGFGLFVYANQAPGRGFYLGDDIGATLPQAFKDAIQQRLAVILSSNRLVDILWEYLTVHADPNGLLRVKPLMPGVNGVMELHLGGFSRIKFERWNPDDYPLSLEVEQEGYRKLRAECMASQAVLEANGMDWGTARAVGYQAGKNLPDGHPDKARLTAFGALPEPVLHRRRLTALMEKYHLPFERFIPSGSGLPLEEPLPHSTTISENWNCADSTSLNCQLTWTESGTGFEILTNQVICPQPNSNQRARADSDLAGDDHYSQAVWDVSEETARGDTGCVVRYASANHNNFYMGLGRWNQNILMIWKNVAGSFTQLGANISLTLTAGTTVTGKFQADGSTLEIFTDGTSRGTRTDTALTGQVRVGIWGHKETSGNAIFDTFEAADLAAAAARNLERIERHLLRGHLRGVMRGTL